MSVCACLFKSQNAGLPSNCSKQSGLALSVLKLTHSKFFKHGGYYINWMTSQIISREDEANQSRRVCARACVHVRVCQEKSAREGCLLSSLKKHLQ